MKCLESFGWNMFEYRDEICHEALRKGVIHVVHQTNKVHHEWVTVLKSGSVIFFPKIVDLLNSTDVVKCALFPHLSHSHQKKTTDISIFFHREPNRMNLPGKSIHNLKLLLHYAFL